MLRFRLESGAAGNDLNTWYTWEGVTLTQHVDLTARDIVYPVLIDPAWSYTLTYEIPDISVSSIFYKLHDCFNCYFPVEGAPAEYPSQTFQYLPLVVRPGPTSIYAWNFSCYWNGDWFFIQNGDTFYGFDFMAAPGHVDGVGSEIQFAFNSTWDSNGESAELVVWAYIVNDNPMGIGRPAYVVGAGYNWAQFAYRLGTL